MDQLPRLGKRELVCLLLFTCNYVVSVWRRFLFLWVLGMGYVILLWHSLSLPYNYFELSEYALKYPLCYVFHMICVCGLYSLYPVFYLLVIVRCAVKVVFLVFILLMLTLTVCLQFSFVAVYTLINLTLFFGIGAVSISCSCNCIGMLHFCSYWYHLYLGVCHKPPSAEKDFSQTLTVTVHKNVFQCQSFRPRSR